MFKKIINTILSRQKTEKYNSIVRTPIDLIEWCEQWKKNLLISISYDSEINGSPFVELNDIVNYLQKEQIILLKELLSKIYSFYVEERIKYMEDLKDWSIKDEFFEINMPELHAAEELLNLIEPDYFWIGEKHNGAYPIGVVFQCSWDEEHHLGVIMYNGKVLSIGDADVAVDWHSEYEDQI